MKIEHALEHLDPENDDHWTADGLPRMDAVAELTGDRTITRKAVVDADPSLTRDVAYDRAEEAPVDEPVDEPAEPEDEPEEGDAPEVDDEPEPEVDAPAPAETPAESVLDMPIPNVLANPTLTEMALGEMSDRLTEQQRQRSDLDEAMKQTNAKLEIIKRAKVGHDRKNPKRNTEAITAYLERQREVRAERTRVAEEFLRTGANADDIIARLKPGSKLDQAMKGRKPARGAVRPQPRAVSA